MYSNKRQLNKNEHLHDNETALQIKFNQKKVEVEEIGKIVLVFSTKIIFIIAYRDNQPEYIFLFFLLEIVK